MVWLGILLGLLAVGALVLVGQGGDGSRDRRVKPTREAYTSEADAQLKRWREEVAELMARAGAQGDDELLKEVQGVSDQLRRAEEIFVRIQQASSQSWELLRPELESAMQEIAQSLDELRARLREEVSQRL